MEFNVIMWFLFNVLHQQSSVVCVLNTVHMSFQIYVHIGHKRKHTYQVYWFYENIETQYLNLNIREMRKKKWNGMEIALHNTTLKTLLCKLRKLFPHIRIHRCFSVRKSESFNFYFFFIWLNDIICKTHSYIRLCWIAANWW